MDYNKILEETKAAIDALCEQAKGKLSALIVTQNDKSPQVGDVCKFWDDDENAFVVAIYAEFYDGLSQNPDNKHGVRITGNHHTRYWKNAIRLSQDETIDLLFGKDIS